MNQGTRISVTVQLWEEVDEGAKTANAGYSLHPHEEDREKFLEQYWQSLPEDPPRVYARPVDGEFYRAFVDVALYDEIRQEPHGKRFEGNPPEKM